MRIAAAIQGDLERIMKAEVRGAERAVTKALREGGRGLRDDLRRHTKDADLGKLARAWAVRTYRNKGPLTAASFVYPKGRAARRQLAAFDQGVTIRPTRGRYLAIPTQYNRRYGLRGGPVIYQPDELTGAFVIRSKEGHLLLMAKVGRAQVRSRGKVRDRAYINSHLLGSGRAKRTANILKHGAVPMFILKPQVRIEKRIDIGTIADSWADRTARLVVSHWNAEDGRNGR